MRQHQWGYIAMHPNDGRVVSNFIVQALNDEDITIYGDGSQTRSFCYVDDMIDGFIRLMNAPDHETYPKLMNLGNPNEMTIVELAEVVNRLTNNPAGIEVLPDRRDEDDPYRRQPDISRAKEVLGWKPKVSLEGGLAKTIEDFERRMG